MRNVMQEELNSLNENETWELVNLPQGRKPIENRWVYKIKKNAEDEIQHYKARLVAKGFSQKPDTNYNETFSPVVRWDTIRTVLSIFACEGLKLAQFDIKCAFLYGDLNEEIYMMQPQGYEDGTRRCNLEQTNSDPCLFVNKDKPIFLILYVDDDIIAAKDEEKLQEFLKNLEETFSVRIEQANYFLGLQIQHLDDGSIFIHQENYCRKVLDSFNMSSANPVSVPFDKSLTYLDHSEMLQEDIPYRKAVGSLMYLAVVSRPDIAYSVGMLSSVLDKQSKLHWCLVKKVLKYLKGTLRWGILYQSNSACKLLEAFSDADYAGDISIRKSTSGIIFKFSTGTIMWASKCQKCVSLSTTEAEFVVASRACKEAIWLYILFMEIHHLQCVPVLQIDSQSAIRLIKSPEFHNLTKYIDVQYKFVHDKYHNGELNMQYCESVDQAADILTKPLSRVRFQKLKQLIGTCQL
ncbi:Retrovirus-related Pol polyprotein from transposon TNT 1-94 [Araneus ventricosus]|uniref:Retrovirus-related Pol polyprotein from transposon TNT 1-94 n=1 Tax=Araneus ventricosus TaxID=182803 RepID=A0A4Y2IVQ7_ARAVE|nr:Retrovirus-related Pol polyprotein from transposon TNT 1-94 [Araneus ventricosus]